MTTPTASRVGFFARFVHIPYRPMLPVAAIAVVALGRTLEEMALYPDLLGPETFVPKMVLHLAFYAFAFFLMAPVVALSMSISWERAAGAASVGVLAGLLPPLFDLLTGGHTVAVYRYFDTFTWSFLADNQPIGESITCWVVVLGGSLYVWGVTRSLVRGLLALALFWVGVQALVWGVWAAAEALTARPDHADLLHETMYIGGCILLYVGATWTRARPSLLRVNHALPWGLLAALGATLAGHSVTYALGIGVLLATMFQIVIVHNDYFDHAEDTLAGRPPRIQASDVVMWSLFAALLATTVGLRMPHLVLGMAAFYVLWTLYHMPLTRLKKRVGLPYLTEGISAAIAVWMGALGPGGDPLPTALWIVVGLAAAGGAVVSMLKDWKDVAADRAAGVRTVYVALEARGVAPRRTHGIVALLALVALLVPPAVFAATAGVDAYVNALVGLAFGSAAVVVLVRSPTLAVELWLLVLAGYLLALVLAAHGWRDVLRVGPRPGSLLSSEATLLDKAREDLASGDTGDALLSAQTYEAQHPGSAEATEVLGLARERARFERQLAVLERVAERPNLDAAARALARVPAPPAGDAGLARRLVEIRHRLALRAQREIEELLAAGRIDEARRLLRGPGKVLLGPDVRKALETRPELDR